MIALTLAGLMALAALPLAAARRATRPPQPECWVLDSRPQLRDEPVGPGPANLDEARNFATHTGRPVAAARIEALLVPALAADAFLGRARKKTTASTPILIPADVVLRVETAMAGRASAADPNRTDGDREASASLH
jgi:hypothetical protein